MARGVVRLPIVIRRADGSVPERAEILVEGGVGDRKRAVMAWRPGAATLELPIGTLALTAYEPYPPDAPAEAEFNDWRRPDVAEWRAPLRHCSLRPGGDPQPVIFTLERARGVSGTVATNRLDRAFVAPSADGRPLPLAELRRQAVFDTWGGLDRRFDLRDLAPGWWMVGVVDDFRSALTATAMVEVRDGVSRVALTPRPIDDRPLLLDVRDHEDHPIDDCRFLLVLFQNDAPWSQEVHAAPVARGRYQFRTDAGHFRTVAEWLTTGEASARAVLEIYAPSRGRATLAFASWPPGELHVQLPAPVAVPVQLTGYGASGLRDRLAVALWPADVTGEMPRVGGPWTCDIFDAEGRCTFSPLTPGDYWVRVSVALAQHTPGGGDRVRMGVAAQRVRIHAGMPPLVLAAPAVHRVVVEPVGIRPGDSVTLRPADTNRGGDVRREFVPGTPVEFEHVPAGRYRAVVWDSGADVEFEVPGQLHVRLEARERAHIDAIKLTITDARGALARAGFRTGDLLIGVNDVMFTSRNEVAAIGFLLDGKRAVNWHVLRDGAALELASDWAWLHHGGGADVGFVDRQHPEREERR
jgi:hypothetical protein